MGRTKPACKVTTGDIRPSVDVFGYSTACIVVSCNGMDKNDEKSIFILALTAHLTISVTAEINLIFRELKTKQVLHVSFCKIVALFYHLLRL